MPSKGKFIMGRRNWCSIRWDKNTGELSFDIRVERQKGVGETVGYACFLELVWRPSDSLEPPVFVGISSRHLRPAGTVKVRVRSSGALHLGSSLSCFIHRAVIYKVSMPSFLPCICANWFVQLSNETLFFYLFVS